MNENKTAAYATREAAQAMLSRVYMYMSGTYENPNTTYADSSIYYAKRWLKIGRYQLLNRENFMKYNTFSRRRSTKRKPSLRLSVYRPSFQDTIITTVSVVYANIDGMGWEKCMCAKYMELLDETGRGKDACSAFIVPQYVGQDENKKIESLPFYQGCLQCKAVRRQTTTMFRAPSNTIRMVLCMCR